MRYLATLSFAAAQVRERLRPNKSGYIPNENEADICDSDSHMHDRLVLGQVGPLQLVNHHFVDIRFAYEFVFSIIPMLIADARSGVLFYTLGLCPFLQTTKSRAGGEGPGWEVQGTIPAERSETCSWSLFQRSISRAPFGQLSFSPKMFFYFSVSVWVFLLKA